MTEPEHGGTKHILDETGRAADGASEGITLHPVFCGVWAPGKNTVKPNLETARELAEKGQLCLACHAAALPHMDPELMENIRQGLQDVREGRTTPWEEVEQELLNEQWTPLTGPGTRLTGKLTAVDWRTGAARLETRGNNMRVRFDPANREHSNRTRILANCHVNLTGRFIADPAPQTPGPPDIALEKMEHATLGPPPEDREEFDFDQFIRESRDGVCTECRDRRPLDTQPEE